MRSLRSQLIALIILLFNQTSYGGIDWAYCDEKGKAYIIQEMYELDSGQLKPERTLPSWHTEQPVTETTESLGAHRPSSSLSEPSLSVLGGLPTKKVKNAKFLVPDKDYICAYPTALQTDNPELRNSTRCINAEKKHCQLGAGGVAGPGAHEIPKDAWFAQTGVTTKFPNIRCQCGCFVGETYITGISGYERIDALAERAKAMPVGIQLFSLTKGQMFSQPLRGPDFTVGPEEKPVTRIATSSGAYVAVTELHPILVQRNDAWTMIQAKNLEPGDVLMDEEGKIDAVVSLESYNLDPASAKVYNLDTQALDPEEHVISANKILVGDAYWQKRLSEASSRIENLLASSQQ